MRLRAFVRSRTVSAGAGAGAGAAMVDFRRPVVCVLGLPFDAVCAEEAIARVRHAARQREPMLIATANLNFVIAARRNVRFRHSVVHSQLSLADGMPIVWISRLLGLPIPERVPGSGLFERLCMEQVDDPLRVYFYGGPDGAAASACERINASARGVRCVGYESPGYVPLDQLCAPDTVERINQCAPDFVVVSLGAEKGQDWIERTRADLRAPVVSHLGAVVNYAAGMLNRAPTVMQRSGFEWLWRLLEEPRLWRRYLHDGLALANILLSNVLPLWWSGIRHRSLRDPGRPISGALSATGAFEIRLGRVCTVHQIDELVEVLERAAKARTRVAVDLGATEYIDAAAMARFLLLHAYQYDIREAVVFHSASDGLRALFRRFQTSYLLDAPQMPAPTHLTDPVGADA